MVLTKVKDASIKLRSWLGSMGDRLPLVGAGGGDSVPASSASVPESGEQHDNAGLTGRIGSQQEQTGLPSADNSRQQQQEQLGSGWDYTELMGASVPCPSCRGSGRIPTELERTLVALIPVSDKRLKPRRTWLYVSLAVLFCAIVAGILLFFFFPRSLAVESLQAPITNVRIVKYKENKLLVLNFLNSVNLSNYNYFYVRATNASGQAINRFQPWRMDLLGSGANRTGLSLAPRATNVEMPVNYTLTIQGEDDFMVRYCGGWLSKLRPAFIRVQFDVTVTFEYLNRREQDTKTTLQDVCCVPTGNCTY